MGFSREHLSRPPVVANSVAARWKALILQIKACPRVDACGASAADTQKVWETCAQSFYIKLKKRLYFRKLDGPEDKRTILSLNSTTF